MIAESDRARAGRSGMKRQDIGIHTIVEAKLTPFGVHVLAEYIDTEAERAGHPNQKRDRPGPPAGAGRSVEMPLWELLKVFGPCTVSSARLPFEDLSFGRDETREERTAHEAERLAANAQDALRVLAKTLGITDDYKAPEQVSVAVRQFCNVEPPRVPNAPGWWWLDGSVVRVIEQGGKLLVRLSSRLKPINDEQPWRGPAIVDPRVPKPVDDEDVPF